ncbi:hypothetical protein H6G41_28630 [Tolypothrix sp. FACHB-123]|uniref:hypothetical protein n=1 Tax=Tolypothrix sp. FACHB-123 TaxID=2692868 RepID=UPI0016888A4E|nr:hypothetical protein [Tolypothrix sp. FACHB-123]MBD2358531.1 hypothetical protein [Tolypothrix sp. FACHB-123]
MTDNNVKSTLIIEVSPETHKLVETEMVGETEEVKGETKALIEALKKRAQAEAKSAGNISSETYLKAVRQAREAIEARTLVEREYRLEYAWLVLQDEFEKNWYLLMKELVDFSDRLQHTAKAAWEAFNTPRYQR